MILFVDDNARSRQAFAKIIQLHGHEVMEAANATEALRILDSFHLELVITDFVMPNVNGFQLIAHIRQKWPDMPILLMSGFLSPEMAEIISGWSGVKFIPKPIDAPAFLAAVDKLAGKSN
jgi:two-component system, cell cycle sensor histidine kinase and response regulator CckA